MQDLWGMDWNLIGNIRGNLGENESADSGENLREFVRGSWEKIHGFIGS